MRYLRGWEETLGNPGDGVAEIREGSKEETDGDPDDNFDVDDQDWDEDGPLFNSRIHETVVDSSDSGLEPTRPWQRSGQLVDIQRQLEDALNPLSGLQRHEVNIIKEFEDYREGQGEDCGATIALHVFFTNGADTEPTVSRSMSSGVWRTVCCRKTKARRKSVAK